MGIALERAMQCESINRQRQEMCEQIEKDAQAVVESQYVASLQDDRVLVVVQPNWHHGVIGIVASRLVERYGVPVFIGTYEDNGHIRGSARGIPEFNVFDALQSCHDLLGKYGGHKAAGGFSMPGENLELVRERLSEFANQCLEIQHLKPLLKIDALTNLSQVNQDLYQQLRALEPCGIDNPVPIFWTPNVRIIEQSSIGKGHIKMTVAQIIDNVRYTIKAIAWRWSEYCPLPSVVDIAYKLRENHYNGNTTIELEIIGVRLPCDSPSQLTAVERKPSKVNFEYQGRQYSCGIYNNDLNEELRVKNSDGKVLAVTIGGKIGLLGTNRQDAKEVDISQPPYSKIIETAFQALDSSKNS